MTNAKLNRIVRKINKKFPGIEGQVSITSKGTVIIERGTERGNELVNAFYGETQLYNSYQEGFDAVAEATDTNIQWRNVDVIEFFDGWEGSTNETYSSF